RFETPQIEKWSGRGDTRSRVPSPVSSSLISSDNGLLTGRCRTGAADYRAKSPGKKTTPTDRLSGFGTSLATNSDSGERVPRGHQSPYSNPNGSGRASFFRSLATDRGGWRTDRVRSRGRRSGFLRGPSGPSDESIGPGALALPDHADGRRLVNGTYHDLARPPRRATRAPEGFQVVRENGPHD